MVSAANGCALYLANEQTSGQAWLLALDEWALMGNGSIASRLLAALVASSELLSLVVTGRAMGAFWVTGYYVSCI